MRFDTSVLDQPVHNQQQLRRIELWLMHKTEWKEKRFS